MNKGNKGKKLNSLSGEYVQQGVKMKPFQSSFGWRPQTTDTVLQKEVLGHLFKDLVENYFLTLSYTTFNIQRVKH